MVMTRLLLMVVMRGAHDQVVCPPEDGLHKAVLYLIVCKAFDFVQADQGGEVSLY